MAYIQEVEKSININWFQFITNEVASYGYPIFKSVMEISERLFNSESGQEIIGVNTLQRRKIMKPVKNPARIDVLLKNENN